MVVAASSSEGKTSNRISRRRFFKYGALTVVVGGGGYAACSNISQVSEHRHQLPGLREELRVLMVADAHLPWCFVSTRSIREACRRFHPHLVLIAGDSVDKRGNEHLVSYFADLDAPLGRFAILGNWEYWGKCSIADLQQAYAAAGVRLLVNEVVNRRHAGGRLNIVGLDDLLGGTPRLELVGSEAGPAATIVLGHCPELFDRLPDIPLVALAGHTHGGQIAPLGLKMFVPPGSGRYFRGWYQVGPRDLFVTRGMGNSVLPFRLGSRPEIALLTFTPAPAQSS